MHPLIRALSSLVLLTLAATAGAEPKTLDEFNRTVTQKPFSIKVDHHACADSGIFVQVLGAGGDELDDQQASSGYLVWVDGHARVMIDAGPGTALRFEETGAKFTDLLAIAFTQLRADHTADLPAFIDGSRAARRTTPLPIYGPTGNDTNPGFNDWIGLLIGPRGAFPHLSDFLSPLSSGGYEVVPYQVDANRRTKTSVLRRDDISLSAMGTDHGPIPALAWRVDIGNVGITFTGDTANRRQTVADFAKGSALLVASNAAPENVRGAAREMDMPPSQIGRIAAQADVNMVVLSHRTDRTRGRETQTREAIADEFKGPIVFADDLECWGT